jgi:hypothetical protein
LWRFRVFWRESDDPDCIGCLFLVMNYLKDMNLTFGGVAVLYYFFIMDLVVHGLTIYFVLSIKLMCFLTINDKLTYGQ